MRGGPVLPGELVNFLNRHKGETWKAHIYFPPQSLGKFKSYLSILKQCQSLTRITRITTYIQKTSTNVPLGGIAETTHESILLCPNTTPPPHLVLSLDQKSDRRIFVECVMALFGGFIHFLGEFSKTQSLKFNTTLSRQVIRDTCFAFPQLFWYLTPASCNVWMIDWGTNELHLSLEEGLSRCVSFIFFVFCICVFVATFCIFYLRVCGNFFV